MKIVITGAGGFLGQRLTKRLLQLGSLKDSSGNNRAIEQITLVDIVDTPTPKDPRTRKVTGDLEDPRFLRDAIGDDPDSIFHLAAIVSGQAEAQFDLGMHVNLDAARSLLDACRRLRKPPKVIFTSSVAVYGGQLPDVILDSTALTPQSSYGTQKAIGELLLADYSRRGFVDGRALRLPTISVRPGKPNKAASSFCSGIIREPLNGKSAACPVSRTLRLWLSSPRRAIESLIAGHELDAALLDGARSLNLPGISVTVGEMIDSLERIAGREVSARVRFESDPAIERIVASWPAAWDNGRAIRLGMQADPDFDSIVRAYLEDDLHPAKPAQGSAARGA